MASRPNRRSLQVRSPCRNIVNQRAYTQVIRPRQTTLLANALLFSELFHEGQFTVPWHQRYYDWSTSHVLDLLNDLDEAVREDRPCYFLGSIMLVQTRPNHWEINDGQQRMITISLLCAVLCRRFANDTLDTQREAQALRMLFDLDATGVWTMTDAELYTPRINPPVNDQMYASAEGRRGR